MLPSHRTVDECIANGLVGRTPPRRGPKGLIPHNEFESLGRATLAWVSLSQTNGEERQLKDIKRAVNSVAKSKSALESKEFDYRLTNRLLTEFGINLDTGKTNKAEA